MDRGHRLELALLLASAVLLAAGSVLVAGEWAWSWDALNHHIYLGLIAQTPRWHLDVLAASYQGYQYPYVYWPVYWLSTLPISGAWAGALWAGFQAAMLLPPTWLLAYHLLPEDEGRAQAIFERTAACVLALSSILVLAGIGTTANDPMATVPLLWAFAIACRPGPVSDRRAAMAAALWGVSVALKLSHALGLPLLAVWWWRGSSAGNRISRVLKMAAAAAAGFLLAYAPWGWQLWRHTGNPLYPYLPSLWGN